MSEEIRAKGRDYAKFLETLSAKDVAHGNEVNYRNAEAEYQRFLEHFGRESCYLCERPLMSFSKKSPCPHWLLKPKGFKKNDLPALAERYGFYQIQSFLRWVANQDGFAKNINDLPEEGTGTKLFEVTIKYKNLEWAFSCAESDYQGHATSQHAKHQHYHFQMRIDHRPFINYSDFHVPFSKMDVINIEAMRAIPRKMKQRFSFGEGMQSLARKQLSTSSVPLSPEMKQLGHLSNSTRLPSPKKERQSAGTISTKLFKRPKQRASRLQASYTSCPMLELRSSSLPDPVS